MFRCASHHLRARGAPILTVAVVQPQPGGDRQGERQAAVLDRARHGEDRGMDSGQARPASAGGRKSAGKPAGRAVERDKPATKERATEREKAVKDRAASHQRGAATARSRSGEGEGGKGNRGRGGAA